MRHVSEDRTEPMVARLRGQATALRLAGQFKEAGRILNHALSPARPDFTEAWFDLGNSYAALAEYAPAREAMQRA